MAADDVWGSLEQQYPRAEGRGGTPNALAPGNYAAYSAGGYGSMPSGASGLSQALQSMGNVTAGRNAQTGAGFIDPFNFSTAAAGQNIARQNELEGQQRSMFGTQLQGAQLKNDALIRLLSLFGSPLDQNSMAWRGAGSLSGGGNLQQNPFLAMLMGMSGGGAGTGGGGGGSSSSSTGGAVTADPRILAATESRVREAFDRPGGLRSQVQQAGTKQNRYSLDSITGAQRQAALDLAFGRGLSEAYLPAQQATVMGFQPTLRAAETWGQQNITPALVARLLSGQAGA